MLRRKLLLNLGPLVLLLLATAVAAIWLLEGVLNDIERLHHGTWAAVKNIEDLDAAISAVEADLHDLAHSFQRLVLALAIVFLVVINTAVIVLLRMGWIVVQPVDRLIEATEALRREEFDHRVELHQRDEFDQLGQAYNALAQQLQTNEQRRMEVLHQAALTINHELNNAMSIIELQLQLVGRHAPGTPAMANHLREIRQSLGRMTDAVQSLKQVRRIVLTDYLPGTKMLDLKRSVEAEAAID